MLSDVTETRTFCAIHLALPAVMDVLALAVRLTVAFGEYAALIAAARRNSKYKNMTTESC